jgi:hypothetical protein
MPSASSLANTSCALADVIMIQRIFSIVPVWALLCSVWLWVAVENSLIFLILRYNQPANNPINAKIKNLLIWYIIWIGYARAFRVDL